MELEKPVLHIDRVVQGRKEVVFVPWGSKEEFLFPSFPGGDALRACGIRSIGFSSVIPPYHVRRESAKICLILLPLRGQGEFTCGGKRFLLGPGKGLICPPGLDQRYFARSHWEFLWVHMEEPLGWGLDTVRDYRELALPDLQPLREIFRQVRAERELGDSYSDGALMAYLRLMVCRLGRIVAQGEGSRTQRHREALGRVWKEVGEDLSRPWRVEELAALFGASKNRFARIVREAEGLGAMEKVRALRMIRAQELIASGLYKLEHIAPQLGFSSPYALSKAYKKYFGRSPAKREKPSAPREP